MNDYKFKGPQNVTLELKHIIERNYNEYEGGNNIRKGYTVTDKADGERNLLVLENGELFMMREKCN